MRGKTASPAVGCSRRSAQILARNPHEARASQPNYLDCGRPATTQIDSFLGMTQARPGIFLPHAKREPETTAAHGCIGGK
jgi:hypothetical protein